ncbi:hypothetical protein BH11ARM2_BH11ARM2_10840 [soil metagenome]
MGRLSVLIRLAAAAFVAAALAGCGSDASPEVKEPFKPSTPPPGFIEERLKARESAPKPGPPPGKGSR